MQVTDDRQLRPLSHFLARLPPSRGAARAAPSTIARWITKGVNTPAGRVRLKAARLGARWLTDQTAFDELLSAQTAAFLHGGIAVATVRPPVARNRAAEEAAKQLELLGC